MSLDIAVAYAKRYDLAALLIVREGETVVEAYDSGWNAEKPHAIYSGTKSFWGVAAVCAHRDGILDLDETVGATFPAWAEEPGKRLVTLRMLLNLTAGIGFGGLGNAVPTYEKALAVPLKDVPGSTFTYGGIPLQIFGAVLAAKLAPREQTPHDYLRARVLDPIGVTVDSWKTLADGTHPLPTGVYITAREWLKYGAFVMAGGFEETLRGSAANPRYGLGWWLGAKDAPDDLFYASGSGGQGMYVAPSQNLIAVHFGQKASYNHKAFLKRLFT
ncbi:MAG TPA: serine hydrolase [Candidatus Baltobacteraceae bacterium]|jgi:CubicO group peptidase (beta-lactamase class C family)